MKNPDHDWAVQLNLLGSGELVINNRRNAADVTVTNPDGSIRDFDGQSFDARIQDDGRNYKMWIDGVLLADNYFDRPTADSNFRWGMYLGDATLVPPSDNTVILVSGAQTKSWAGSLTAATTPIFKANNTQNLAATASWAGAVVPGLHNPAVWDSTVTAANATTLNTDQTWAGLRITNPGGGVTINGTSLLGLDESGLDMSSASRNLTLNCPVELRVSQSWNIAPATTATASANIRGYGALTLTGVGLLTLSGTNTFTGPVNINAGALRITRSGSLGSGEKSVRINTGVTGNPQLLLDGSSGPITVPASISYLTSNDANGAIINEAGNNTLAGPITLTGGGGNTRIYSNGGSLTLSGPIDSSFITRTLKLMGTATGAVTGSISDGSPILVVSVSKEESGTWTLGGDNAYSGATSVLAGRLILAHPDALGSGGLALGNSAGGTSVTDGAVIDLNGQQGIQEAITIRGNGIGGAGALMKGSSTLARIGNGVSAIRTTAGGTHSAVPTVSITGGGGSGATAVALLGLRAASFSINGGTTVYSTAPTVTISGGGGSGATATAVLSGGVVSGITITSAGFGYSSAPSVTFSGGTVTTPGTAPSGTGNANNFLVIGVQVTNPGSGYTSEPTVAFSSGTGTTALAVLSGVTLGADASLGGSGDVVVEPGISGAFALTKTGAGTVTLRGMCSHAGGTAINGGTLALGASQVLPDAGTISLGGATLNAGTFNDTAGPLDVTGTAVINLGSGAALRFADSSAIDWTGGTLVITGTFVSGSSLRFGTTASGLTSAQLAKISAAGLTGFALDANGYLVASVGVPFSTWQSSNATVGAFGDDHDRDGIANGIEYFLGGSSNTTGPTALPSVTKTAGVLRITWTKSTSYPGSYGTHFWVETSETLVGPWTTETLGGNVTTSGNSITYTFPAVPSGRRFVRLAVTGP